MKLKRIRKWLLQINIAFNYLVINQVWCRGWNHSYGWNRNASFWCILLIDLAFLVFISKSRNVNRAILRGLAWENKRPLNFLSTTLLLYGLLLTFILPTLAFYLWSGVIPAANWHDELVLQVTVAGPLLILMLRLFDGLMRSFYFGRGK